MKRAKGATFVTSRAEEYKRYARQCVEIASTFQDEEARATVIGQARAWLRLAHLSRGALSTGACEDVTQSEASESPDPSQGQWPTSQRRQQKFCEAWLSEASR